MKKVIVKDFRLPTYGDSTGTLSFEEPAEVSFMLYPKREDLTYRITPSKIEDGKWKFSKNLLEFNKISSRTSDKKIERAKKNKLISAKNAAVPQIDQNRLTAVF